MKVALFIARHLRLAPSGSGRRSPAVAIAAAGVALAVAVMLISLAVVLGFQEGIKQKVLGFEPSITIRPLGRYVAEEATLVELPGAMEEAITEAAPQAQVALTIAQPAVLKTPDSFAGVVLTGFSLGHDTSFEQGNLIEGTLPAEDNDVMISALVANNLGVKLGEKIDACFFIDGAIKLRRLKVCGIYSSSFSDYDRLTAYAQFPLLQKIVDAPEGYGTAIELRGVPLDSIADTSLRLQSLLRMAISRGEITTGLSVESVLESGAMYFNWLSLLDSNVIVILVIMTIISGFTLISCMFILILQRVKEAGMLKALGATDGLIRRVFLLLGGKVVAIGLLAGNIAGLLLIFLQWKWHLLTLDPQAYFLTFVPVHLTFTHFIMVNVGAIVMATLVMLIPSAIVGRISPAKTMHYE